jgi:peptidoglycan/xylan/chitin deacetylase (PgdA/CDA1 family)
VLVSPGIVERILVEGHTVGNHGFTHRRMDWKNGRWVLAEIRRTDETIEKITGRRPVWFRPPYGRFDPRFRRWMLATGHRMALWSLLAGDFLELGPDALVDRIRRCLHQGAIVVLHDGHEKTPDMLKALPGILRAIRSAGLSPGPLPTVSKPMNSPAANTGIPQGNE